MVGDTKLFFCRPITPLITTATAVVSASESKARSSKLVPFIASMLVNTYRTKLSQHCRLPGSVD